MFAPQRFNWCPKPAECKTLATLQPQHPPMQAPLAVLASDSFAQDHGDARATRHRPEICSIVEPVGRHRSRAAAQQWASQPSWIFWHTTAPCQFTSASRASHLHATMAFSKLRFLGDPRLTPL
jgi:hypothetical protein